MRSRYLPFFRLYILFSQYRSCDDTQEIWSFVSFIKVSMTMSACTLFNEQDKGSIPLSIITWSVLRKQNVQAKKVYCSLGYPKCLQTRRMYKRLLALRSKLSTWRSQSDGFSWKIMPSNFNQLFRSIPCTRGGSGLEILPCTTISHLPF